MTCKKYVITKENILWFLLLLCCAGTLYSTFFTLPFLIILIFNTLYYMHNATGFYNKGIILLLNYTPFYTLIRVNLIYLKAGLASNLLNYFRDLVIIILFISCIRKKDFKINKPDFAWIIFFLNWGLGLAVSSINGYPLLGISGFHLSAIPMLLFYIVVYDNAHLDVSIFINQFLKIATIVALVGLVAYYARPSVYCQLFSTAGNQIDAADYVRFVSFFFTPNVCGCFLAIAISISLVEFLYKHKWGYLGLIILFVYCVILTLSRGAWLFTVSSFLITFCLMKPKVGLPIFFIIGIGFAFYYLSDNDLLNSNNFMTNIIKDRVISIFDRTNTSSYGRVSAAMDALKQLKYNPWGYGLGMATTAQINYGNISNISTIDGFYMKSVIETGILGIVYVCTFVIWLLERSFWSYRGSKNEAGALAILVVIGFLLQSVGSNTFDFICTAPWVWIILGIAVKKTHLI
ncbi:MAG: O-antigen ligase family protein [Lachnospiraceae bacterium]|nr:O-antigen ligase family protein [Lachnospiraceae bacterium]